MSINLSLFWLVSISAVKFRFAMSIDSNICLNLFDFLIYDYIVDNYIVELVDIKLE